MRLSSMLAEGNVPSEFKTPGLKRTGEDTADAVAVVNGSELPEDDGLLAKVGLDPKRYAIDYSKGVRHKSWDALRRVRDAETDKVETVKERMTGVQFSVIERPVAVDLSDLEGIVTAAPPVAPRCNVTEQTLLLALGDLQLGKLENSLEGVIARFNEGLEAAVLEANTQKVDTIVIAWMGDCIEGFVSQNGANAWRTVLTLTEQLRIIRRLMLRAIDRFIDEGYTDIVAISVPGNHGDTIRVPVTTRSDDSFDTDALVAVWETLEANPARYGGKVSVVTPEVDEIGVVISIEGVSTAFIHGHQFRPNQHWKWWEGQSLGRTAYGEADVLFTGHGHHTVIEERSERTFVMAPSLEERSTWWVQRTGQTGNPGVILARFSDGEMVDVHKVTTRAGMKGANDRD